MTEQSPSDGPPPMIKEETIKDDGRTLIYYTFPDAQDAPAPSNPLPEATHV